MKKRDRAIVAVILAAALVVGLVLVRRALERDAQAQADSLASAQFNGAAGTGENGGSDAAAQEGSGAVPGQADGGGGASEEDDAASGGGADGEDGAASGGEAAQEGGGTGSSSAQTGGTATGLAAESPSAGGGEMTLAELSQWMENESSGALSAQSMLAAEEALAAGVGTADDALRRTFAQSQAGQNDEARRSQLAEEAASLGLAYLRCRDLAALREESVAFYEALAAAISAQTGTEAADQVQADLQTVEGALAAAELALEEAQADLQSARDDLNAALGNPYGTEISVTDALVKAELPTLTGDAAAAQALAARNEIKGAAYEAERARQALTQLRYTYAPDAPEVLEQQSAVQEAQAACARVSGQVEADVRDRLTRLNIQDQELALLSASLEKTGTAAPEADYVLSGGEEGAAWSSNLSQLMEQWAEIESARASLAAGIAQFNLDVLCFQHAIGAGCTVVTI